MDKEKVFTIITLSIIILLLFLLSSFIIYKILLNKLTKVIQVKILEQRLNDNEIDVDALKSLLFNKVKVDVMKEIDKKDKKNDYNDVLNKIFKENNKLKDEILSEIDKKLSNLKRNINDEFNIKLANLKKEIKTELEIELLAKINKSSIQKSIVISKIDDEESRDIINEFWKFIKAISENNSDEILSYLYNPIYNFNSGSDIGRTDQVTSFLKFNEGFILNEENYKDFFDINSIYFFKSGFRPPLTERVKYGEKLIVFSVNIDKELKFPFPSDEKGESTFYWIKTPEGEKKILAVGILSDILSQ